MVIVTTTAAPARPWFDHVADVLGPVSYVSPAGMLRAELEDGSPVICRRHPIPDPALAATTLERLRSLALLRHPNLLAILGGGERGASLWVFSEDDSGVTLDTLLERRVLTPAQAVAVVLSALSGLEALERAGHGHGALGPRSVRVAGSGQVRLADFGINPRLPAGPGPAWPEARRDVAADGALLFLLLGINADRGRGGQAARNERAFPGLAATALTIASGNAGRSATTALNMLRDAAGRLAGQGRVHKSTAELERLVGNRAPAIRAAVDAVVTKAAPIPAAVALPRTLAPARLVSPIRARPQPAEPDIPRPSPLTAGAGPDRSSCSPRRSCCWRPRLPPGRTGPRRSGWPRTLPQPP